MANNYIVIPGTNIRLYDGDTVTISNSPNTIWDVHYGWFTCFGVQDFGWYLVSDKSDVLPVSVIDLTLCSLATAQVRGSIYEDGKVTEYTDVFTKYDAEILSRTFITLDTIAQRDNLDPKTLINGRIVRVNNVDGAPAYYIWDANNKHWDIIEDQGIPEVTGDSVNPIVLSKLNSGLYRVKGTYLISPTWDIITNTSIDHLVFVDNNDPINVKVITQYDLVDYKVENDIVIESGTYATTVYVDGCVSVLEQQLTQIINSLKAKDIGYNAPDIGPTSTSENVQQAIDALNAAISSQGQEVFYGTTEYWDSQLELIAQEGRIYVYSDHNTFNSKSIPGIKVGDGTSYLIDMPFIDDKYAAHIVNTIIHVSTDDREYWGDKVTCNLDPLNNNILVFTKE